VPGTVAAATLTGLAIAGLTPDHTVQVRGTHLEKVLEKCQLVSDHRGRVTGKSRHFGCAFAVVTVIIARQQDWR